MNLDNWFIPFLDFSDSNDSNFVREGLNPTSAIGLPLQIFTVYKINDIFYVIKVYLLNTFLAKKVTIPIITLNVEK